MIMLKRRSARLLQKNFEGHEVICDDGVMNDIYYYDIEYSTSVASTFGMSGGYLDCRARTDFDFYI